MDNKIVDDIENGNSNKPPSEIEFYLDWFIACLDLEKLEKKNKYLLSKFFTNCLINNNLNLYSMNNKEYLLKFIFTDNNSKLNITLFNHLILEYGEQQLFLNKNIHLDIKKRASIESQTKILQYFMRFLELSNESIDNYLPFILLTNDDIFLLKRYIKNTKIFSESSMLDIILDSLKFSNNYLITQFLVGNSYKHIPLLNISSLVRHYEKLLKLLGKDIKESKRKEICTYIDKVKKIHKKLYTVSNMTNKNSDVVSLMLHNTDCSDEELAENCEYVSNSEEIAKVKNLFIQDIDSKHLTLFFKSDTINTIYREYTQDDLIKMNNNFKEKYGIKPMGAELPNDFISLPTDSNYIDTLGIYLSDKFAVILSEIILNNITDTYISNLINKSLRILDRDRNSDIIELKKEYGHVLYNFITSIYRLSDFIQKNSIDTDNLDDLDDLKVDFECLIYKSLVASCNFFEFLFNKIISKLFPNKYDSTESYVLKNLFEISYQEQHRLLSSKLISHLEYIYIGITQDKNGNTFNKIGHCYRNNFAHSSNNYHLQVTFRDLCIAFFPIITLIDLFSEVDEI